MSLAERALLVDLTTGIFGNEIKNQSLANELAETHQADKDSLRVVEKLLSKIPEYEDLKKARNEVCRFHDTNTQPWSYGVRILAAKRFMKYNEGMQSRIDTLWAKSRIFISKYEEMERNGFSSERASRNGLFNQSQYPSSEYVRNRTRCEIVYSQVPDSGDFRVDLDEDSVKVLTEQIQNREKSLQIQASKFQIERIQRALERFKRVMSSEKPRIFGSLFSELRNAIDPLNDFSELDDSGTLSEIQNQLGPKLNELASGSASDYKGKDSQVERNEALKAADDLASKLMGFM